MAKWDEACPRASALGHSICSAATLATINVVQDEGLVENSEKVRAYMLKRLKELSEEHILIGDLRGKGLFLGLEFVSDRDKKTPATKETRALTRLTAKKGLLLFGGGLNGQSLRIVPPLITTEEQAETAVIILDEALTEIER